MFKVKELEPIFEELENYFELKASEAREKEDYGSYIEGRIKNRKAEVDGFKIACLTAETNPMHRNEVISNFKRDAAKIKSRIDEIIV